MCEFTDNATNRDVILFTNVQGLCFQNADGMDGNYLFVNVMSFADALGYYFSPYQHQRLMWLF